MSAKRIKVMLVGGGTGGHVVPIFEVYNKLKSLNKSIDITVVGSGSIIEKHFFDSILGYRTIKTGKLRRHYTLKNITEAIFVLAGFIQSFFILVFDRPTVIFSKGGFVAVPIITWAKILHIPFMIHESDTTIGIGNRIGISHAQKIFVAFPERCYSNLPKDRTVFSVPIVREGLRESCQAEKEYFGFENDDKVILVTGGSQGSHNINKNIIEIMKELLTRYNVVHQVGEHDFQIVERFRNTLDHELRNKYYTTVFLNIEDDKDMMVEAIKLADLAIARAGATTIFELAVTGKPTILVPWKHSAADHQAENAKLIEDTGGAVVISDDGLSSEIILRQIDKLFASPQKMEELSKNIKAIFTNDGLEKICREIVAIGAR